MSSDGISKPLSDVLGALPCGYETWSTIWGDPILSGTVLMVGYGVTGVAVVATSRQLEGRERFLWQLCALVLFVLLLNTHLDLQAFVWSFGKCLAKARGWYENRHSIQASMILAALAAIVVIGLLILVYFRRSIVGNFFLILGMSIVVGITIVEAIDYSRLERYYAVDFGYFEGDDLIELLGLLVVLIAVALRRRKFSLDPAD